MGGGIIFQMDKTKPEDKKFLGNQYECSICADMGGTYPFDSTVDMPDPGWDTGHKP
jgi:hypothetical protein